MFKVAHNNRLRKISDEVYSGSLKKEYIIMHESGEGGKIYKISLTRRSVFCFIKNYPPPGKVEVAGLVGIVGRFLCHTLKIQIPLSNEDTY